MLRTIMHDETGNDGRNGTKRRDALHHSEERFRILVEGVKDYAIFMLDPDGYVSSWNAGAERIKGYRSSDILGKHFSTFYTPEDNARSWPERELEIARKEGRFQDEGWRVRQDGSRFWANVVITALYDTAGEFYGFAKVTRDMTERRKIEQLEETGRRMNEFLAMLAHELRNPLAPIRNAVSVLQMTSSQDPNVDWTREVLDRQVGHLTRLVDDLLDVSRITTGKITLMHEPVDLVQVVHRAVEASRPLIDSRGHALELGVPGSEVRVIGDATRLTQVVVNLLNNAAKYTPEGGTISVRAMARGGYATLSIADTGIGIRPEMQSRIFELFSQGDRALDRSEGGLGIGLTIVQRLVTMHGGRVTVSSQGPGRGSEFVVQLPLAVPAALPARRDRGSAAEPEQRRRRVLVVDDNRDSAESMEHLLRMWGHDVRTAFDGPTALFTAADFIPDVVLLDLGLPRMDGYEVAQRLRGETGLRDVVLVAMTGYGQEEDRRRTQGAGFAHHLVKPADPGLLREVIAAVPAGGGARPLG
jgi:PAS domain S-box-containing protein